MNAVSVVESLRKKLDYIKCEMWTDAPDFDEPGSDELVHYSMLIDDVDNMLAELEYYDKLKHIDC